MLLTKEQNNLLKSSYGKGNIPVSDDIYQLVCSLTSTGYIEATTGIVNNQHRYINFRLLPTGRAYVEDILAKEQTIERESESLVVAKKSLKVSSSARLWSIIAAVAAITAVIVAIVVAICQQSLN